MHRGIKRSPSGSAMDRGGPSSRAMAANCACDCGYNRQMLLGDHDVIGDEDEEDSGGDPQMPLVDDDPELASFWMKCRCVHCGQGNGCKTLIAPVLVFISGGLCESCREHTGLPGLHLLAQASRASRASRAQAAGAAATSSEPGAPAAAAATAVSQLAGVVHDSSERGSSSEAETWPIATWWIPRGDRSRYRRRTWP